MTTDFVDRVRNRLAGDRRQADPVAVATAVRAEAGGVLGHDAVLDAARQARDEFIGAGPLAPLLDDPATTDVLVTGPHEVWTDGPQGLIRSGIRFKDEESVRRLAQRLALAAGRRLDDAQPYVDGWLPGAGPHGRIRVHAVLPPIAAGGTCLSLRVLRPATHDLTTLGELGAFDEAGARLLRTVVSRRMAFLVTGGTGAGKTTLLAALLGAVDPGERIVCVEDAGELQPAHPQFVGLVARPPNVEGAGAVGLPELVRQALRMRPDRLVVGEVRGAEVGALLTALNTGHDGGACTVHANSPAEVPARIEALAALGGLGRDAVHSQLVAAIRVVLHMRREADGRRRLAEVGVLRAERGRARVVPVWRAGRWTVDRHLFPTSGAIAC
ncbi:pilus assembly protein CpaF [Amycolatopsis mediterranei S699]|uniref:Pilus assembly protein CpaF n=2 Tax=Amycolatopsis mediterranei TaxID=33910 RepID=A0A0H3DJZ9_AMYMU|nr:TadA family conjugal transfer-associated ATPase [Amycolatopsis mediterranei]ADJ50498.1 pilus assembly protein CpaF [Amycolatopsis mediterranei U32]AEK47503.1 pilus assembly protein CpaF [Amycolatopsis mediterranei S699]AFO82204.1 pilus assembly protein CpaF [Amycolatopsis mediterranei S699]AGT89333.1 pilus assembly protein CpaF [Amycolatopsis mediterranei RB]KDO09544.1 ATPase [Amycolatopsis mediterranei]